MEPHFASLGKDVRSSSISFKAQWFELASGDMAINKVFAITFGYALVGFGLAVYMNIINVGSMRTAGRAVRSIVRQHLVIVKVMQSSMLCQYRFIHGVTFGQVAGFVLIELVLFPLACGVMLDICTLNLFPNASFALRIAFSWYAPLTSAFYHWMIGTMFMSVFPNSIYD